MNRLPCIIVSIDDGSESIWKQALVASDAHRKLEQAAYQFALIGTVLGK